jgi:hypothetical protein
MTRFTLGTLSIFVAACAAAPAAPPPGAVQADIAFPSPGTRWVTRTTDQSGAVSTRTFTVVEEGVYEGKPVYRLFTLHRRIAGRFARFCTDCSTAVRACCWVSVETW